MAAARSRHRSQIFHELDECLHKDRLVVSPLLLALLIYLPIGLVLFVVRACMLLQSLLIFYIIPKGAVQRFLLRILFGVMGLIVINRDFRKKRSSIARMLVCNKISNIDHIALHLTMECTTTSLIHRPLLSSLFYHYHFDTDELPDVEEQLRHLPEFDDNVSIPDSVAVPYVAQPEPLPTSGNRLISFRVWPFVIEDTVQPMILTSWRPIPIPLTVLDSTGLTDLLWTMFLPFTIVTVRMLSVVDAEGTKSHEEFSLKVREHMSTSLEVPCVNVIAKDIKQWKEEFDGTAPVARTSSSTQMGPIISEADFSKLKSQNPELDKMVYQVIGVLPHVPAQVARQDLMRTGSVDITVTNILEGRVNYDPLMIEFDHNSGQASLSREQIKPTFSLENSQKSFQEKKHDLVQNARKRYIQKHGLS